MRNNFRFMACLETACERLRCDSVSFDGDNLILLYLTSGQVLCLTATELEQAEEA